MNLVELGTNKEIIISGLRLIIEKVNQTESIRSSYVSFDSESADFCGHKVLSGAQFLKFEMCFAPLKKEKINLSPCPFCGCTDVFLSEDEHKICCRNCKSSGPAWCSNDMEAAISSWNNRV